MHLTKAQTLLWLTPAVMEVVIVVAIIYKRLWRNLPIFSSYLIFKVARTAFLFLERHNDVNYFYAFWITEALQSFATLCVIKELFDNAFEQHLGLRRLGNVLFQWSIAILIVVAVLIAFTTPEADVKKLMAGIMTLKRFVTVVQSGLFAFLFLFAFVFGLGWQHYATGVCLGFGIYGIVELAMVTARTLYGPSFTPILNWVLMSVDNCCVFLWAAYFLLPQPKQAVESPIHVNNRLEEWNQALLQLMRR
jgi:hypothetical protein